MVQIRITKGRVPNAGAPFRFWGRFRFRIRRRRLVLRPKFNDSRTSFFKDIDSGDGHSGEQFDLRKMVRREKKGLRRFAQNWALVGTGRWCKVARSRFLLKGGGDVKRKDDLACTESGKEEDKEDTAEKAIACSQVKGKTDKPWGFNKKVGRVNIASWVTGKGKRSLTRQPLIRQESEDEDTGKSWQKKEVSSKVEGCFGCTGPRIWRSKEKSRKEVEDIVPAGEHLKTDTENVMSTEGPPALPDDILEMCLAWIPFLSLMRARAVCKKWKSLSMSPHFLQLRERIRYREPWLFLFGLSRDGVCLGQIQALDPTSNTWHTIKAETLTGRLLYSVTAVNSSIYVVGGCSTNSSSGSARSDKSSVRTLKTVQIYTPLTGSWRKVCPMTTERASPIVGVFKQKEKRTEEGLGREVGHRVGRGHLSRVSDPYIELHSLARRRVSERGSRRGGELAVFGGAENRGERNEHGFSGNLESRASKYDESLETPWRNSRVHGWDRVAKEQRNFGLIAVGGHGKWTEQLDSAEIYDPVTDRWREIASLPADHGSPCAGVVCKNFFYVYSRSNKLAAYDLEHEYWHSIQVSQGPARLLDYTPKLVSCRERVFLLGVAWGVVAEGGQEMATRKIWELYQEPTFTGWVKVSQHPDAPLDWNAVFVADDEKIFGVEMFKIFGQMLDFVTICRVSGSKPMGWERVSRMQMAMHEIDPSSCLTKTAVVVQL